MDPRLLSTIISSIVGIFVPLTIWYLNRREKNQEIEEIEKQIKRLSLIERISKISAEADIDTKQLIKSELEKAIEVLHPPNEENEALLNENIKLLYDALPKWRKALLLFKPKNIKVILLQLVFYYLIYSMIPFFGELIFNAGIDKFKNEELPEITMYIFLILFLFLQFIIIKFVHTYAVKIQRN